MKIVAFFIGSVARLTYFRERNLL